MGGKFRSQHFCHRQLARFGGGVDRRAGVAEHPCAVDRRDDDNRAPPLFQVGDGVFDGEECAFEIDVNRLVPLLRGDLFDGRPDAVDAGVGDHNIQPPPGVNRLLDDRLGLLHRRDIAEERDCLAARSPNLLHHFVELAGGAAHRRNLRPLLGHQQGRALANPRPRAGHQRDFACQLHREISYSSMSSINYEDTETGNTDFADDADFHRSTSKST